MKIRSKNNGRIEYDVETMKEVENLSKKGRVGIATIHETMGPHFKDIYWIKGRPSVIRKRI